MSDTPCTPTPEQLTLLSAIIRDVARSGRLRGDQIEDFAQSVHLRLARRHYDIFLRFSGRSSLRTFLTVAVTRMLLDWRNAVYGKWRPSAAARRLGPWAVRLERLCHRDGYTANEAVRYLSGSRDAPGSGALDVLAEQLPARQRPREVQMELDEHHAPAIENFVEAEERRLAERHSRAELAAALRRLPAGDRRLIRMRYSRGLTIRAIAASLDVDPKVMYRRVERVIRTLRATVREPQRATGRV